MRSYHASLRGSRKVELMQLEPSRTGPVRSGLLRSNLLLAGQQQQSDK